MLNMKFLLPIIFTTSLFAQDNSNKISYTIETTKQYYNNVSIDSVYGLQVELYDRNLITTFNIPISEIKSLKQNGLRSNILATIIGTAAGAGCGALAAFYAMMIFHSQGATEDVAVIVSFGGSVMLGYKLGSNIFKREYKVIEFEGWTLDEKRNHLKSIVR